MIETRDLARIYPRGKKGVQALRGVDIKIEKEEFVSIMGPSGSGKSTLLHTLGLLDTPTGGQYFLEGTDTSELSEKEKTRIRNQHFGFVFQAFNLLQDFNALENVMIPLIYSKVPTGERKERALKLLKNMGLKNRYDHHPNELSGGEQQRVAVARALANDPTLIFADEPTGDLNTEQGDQIMDIFSALNKDGVTIIMVTHSDIISKYAKRIINIQDGRIIEPVKDD